MENVLWNILSPAPQRVPCQRRPNTLTSRTLHRNSTRIRVLPSESAKGFGRNYQNLRFAFPHAKSPCSQPKFTLFNSKAILFRRGFRHQKMKIFKKSFKFKKSSLGDKLESAILAGNSKKQKSCIYLNSDPPFARGSRLQRNWRDPRSEG